MAYAIGFALPFLALAWLAPGRVVSVAAGALSFLSPCVLPLVPTYLAFLTGVAGAEARADATTG